MEKQLYKSGDQAPETGNYRFQRHEREVTNCFPRYGAYLHLQKGTKLPVHDDCQEACVYSLMTITNEEDLVRKTKATA